ncbi:N-terminal kinase-like protein yata [Dermatophagoides pteronyssinus]|uniref:N-terminal kinase-like protein yata n=1 Tax=Dermatophagoides pteronyssinus TaxID=6956 RepID=UPI003F666CDF
MWSIFSRDPSKDFGYEVNEPILQDENSFWILHKGKKKATGEIVSVFRYESKSNDSGYMDLARNSLKRLKTLRHPSILTYLDSLETDKYILIVTEHVQPLHCFLEEINKWPEKQKESAISWGIYSISKGLCFLNNDCKMIHGNLSLGSIFINDSCDWKLFNFEYLTNIGSIQPSKSFYPHKIYTAPELQDNNRATCDKRLDAWGLSCLIWEIFNGKLNEQAQLKNLKRLPKKLIPLYSNLNKTSSQRCLIEDFLSNGQDKNGYFKNPFIDTLNFLEEIQIKDSTEKNRFFSNLNNGLESFPVYFCKNKILSFVITSLEYGEANCHCLELLMKIGKMLNENEYQKKVTPSIIKLFASKDRSIRSKLLKEIDEYIDYTSTQAVNDQIFPYLVHGFMDSNPVIREQTVKSIFHLASKLNNQNLNEEVIKHFSRIQMKDPEGGIRTNTIICLGKIAAHLQPQTRQTIMLPLFLRSLRDPFPPSRIACIQSLDATQNFFTLQDCTSKIMPALCLILMDPEKQVRDHAFVTLKNFVQKIEKFSENPSLIEHMESEINKSGSNVSSKFTTGLSWAVNSLAAKLTRTKIESDNHNEDEQKPKQSIQNNHSLTVNQDKHQNNDNENILKNDDQMKIKSIDDLTGNSDGWEGDGWENDLLEDWEKNVPMKPVAPKIHNKNNDENGWDNDIDWGENNDSEDKNENKLTTIKKDDEEILKPRIRQTRISSTTKPGPKKGPMKLGAQKLKKSFD